MSNTNNTPDYKAQTTGITEALAKAFDLLEEQLLSEIPALRIISASWGNCPRWNTCSVQVWSADNEVDKELVDYVRQAKDAKVEISVLEGGDFHHCVTYRRDDYTLEIVFITDEPAAVEYLVNPGVRDEQ